MKVLMYGAEICPDCVEAKKILGARSDIELDYRNITTSTQNLKEFLHYRDHDEVFADVIKEGRIGIPFFILEDGTKTFEVTDIIEDELAAPRASACSIDGKGHC